MKRIKSDNQTQVADSTALKPLTSLPIGGTAVIEAVLGSSEVLSHKLLTMGFVEGASVSVLSKAPLGGPLKVSVRGYLVSLRASEAAYIHISQ